MLLVVVGIRLGRDNDSLGSRSVIKASLGRVVGRCRLGNLNLGWLTNLAISGSLFAASWSS
jgi:hypothetical protein